MCNCLLPRIFTISCTGTYPSQLWALASHYHFFASPILISTLNSVCISSVLEIQHIYDCSVLRFRSTTPALFATRTDDVSKAYFSCPVSGPGFCRSAKPDHSCYISMQQLDNNIWTKHLCYWQYSRIGLLGSREGQNSKSEP